MRNRLRSREDVAARIDELVGKKHGGVRREINQTGTLEQRLKAMTPQERVAMRSIWPGASAGG